jgi:hypothetical protein
MGSPVVLGKDAKVRLNSVALGVRSGSIVETAADHEVGDTEDNQGGATGSTLGNFGPNAFLTIPIGFETHEGGRRVADITMEWFSNFALIPVTTFGIIAGSILSNVAIYPKGTSLPFWTFSFITVLRNEPVNVDINQPQTARWTGKSSGPYTAPQGG